MDAIYQSFFLTRFRYTSFYRTIQGFLKQDPRAEILEQSMDFVSTSRVSGDYLEFGVYKGNSLAYAFHAAQRFGLRSMRFFAFDSFKGLPQIQGPDLDSASPFREGDYACSIDDFRNNMRRNRVDLSKVQIIPGWFDKLKLLSPEELQMERAAVVLVDCDLYESTAPVLEFLTRFVQEGTVIIFDDWNYFKGDPDKGQRRAFGEWLAKNEEIQVSEFLRYGWNHTSFLVNRR